MAVAIDVVVAIAYYIDFYVFAAIDVKAIDVAVVSVVAAAIIVVVAVSVEVFVVVCCLCILFLFIFFLFVNNIVEQVLQSAPHICIPT